MTKYILFKYDSKKFASRDTIEMYPVKRVELTAEDLKAIGYSITNTCEAFGDKLPNVVSKIRKVLE